MSAQTSRNGSRSSRCVSRRVSAPLHGPSCKEQKEERAHDERVANANYRIKQAGQVYERKVKKNPEDAAEEHSRYINLLSSLGLEITQEKQSAFSPLRSACRAV